MPIPHGKLLNCFIKQFFSFDIFCFVCNKNTLLFISFFFILLANFIKFLLLFALFINGKVLANVDVDAVVIK